MSAGVRLDCIRRNKLREEEQPTAYCPREPIMNALKSLLTAIIQQASYDDTEQGGGKERGGREETIAVQATHRILKR